MAKRSVISQLASVSEGALGKLAGNEMTHRAFQGALQVKERVERMVHAIGELDDRVAALEKRVDALEKPKRRAPARRRSTSKSSAESRSSAGESTSS